MRGDKSFLLEQDGRLLKAGDVTGDNEVDEDDVNAIDAAWGSNAGAAYFKQADMNNDSRVGVEDLSLVTSNIDNSRFWCPSLQTCGWIAVRAGVKSTHPTTEEHGFRMR